MDLNLAIRQTKNVVLDALHSVMNTIENLEVLVEQLLPRAKWGLANEYITEREHILSDLRYYVEGKADLWRQHVEEQWR